MLTACAGIEATAMNSWTSCARTRFEYSSNEPRTTRSLTTLYGSGEVVLVPERQIQSARSQSGKRGSAKESSSAAPLYRYKRAGGGGGDGGGEEGGGGGEGGGGEGGLGGGGGGLEGGGGGGVVICVTSRSAHCEVHSAVQSPTFPSQLKFCAEQSWADSAGHLVAKVCIEACSACASGLEAASSSTAALRGGSSACCESRRPSEGRASSVLACASRCAEGEPPQLVSPAARSAASRLSTAPQSSERVESARVVLCRKGAARSGHAPWLPGPGRNSAASRVSRNSPCE
mmetsp:Transcript_27125/g.67211  ORF Transcript_27125/g.67211 Transcript_27125/m.67211 type:complete len:288 (-) Transcript_27125:93-956(-)